MNDDLDEDIMGADDGFDEFSQKEGLGDSIRKNPYAKIGIVVIAIVAIVGILLLFGGDPVEEQPSVIPSGSDITSVPGTDEKISPAYIEAVEQQNEANLERAINENDSSIPVPINTYETRLEVPETEERTEDPLLRWRQLQEERVARELKIQEAEAEPVTVLNAEQQGEAISDLAESMQQQMSSLLTKNDTPKPFNTTTLIEYTSQNQEGQVGALGGPGQGNNNLEEPPFEEEEPEEVVIIPAGRIVYGQMLLEANTDVPSMVLAQMVSGPLKGWKLLGEFQALEDLKKIAITFRVAVNEDGDQYDLNAVMLDPKSGLAALQTSVDNRYLKRIVFPAAAAFVQGFASAVSESGRTTVTIQGETVAEEEEESTDEQEIASGIEEAGQELSQILDEMGDVPIQIVIAAGTPIGIFFTENVVGEEGDI